MHRYPRPPANNEFLRLPDVLPPTFQAHAAWTGVLIGMLAIGTIFTLGTLTETGLPPDLHTWLPTAFAPPAGTGDWLNNILHPATWPSQSKSAGVASIIFGVPATVWGYRDQVQHGFIQLSGNLILPPKKLFRGFKNNGIKFGRAVMSRVTECNGFLIVGGMGGGKSQTMLRMMGQAWSRHERALILDAKLEFVAPAINFHGDGLGVTDPADTRRTWLLALTDLRAARWAVWEDVCDRESARLWASSLTAGLDTSSQAGGSFWSGGAVLWFNYAALLCIRDFKKWSLGDWYSTLMALLKIPPEMMKTIIAELLEAESMMITPEAEQTLAGFRTNLAQCLGPIEEMVRWERKKNPKLYISIVRWLKSRDNLIIGASSLNLKMAQAYANGFLELAAAHCLRRPNAEPDDSEAATWLFLDEYSSAGKCELLSEQIVQLRSKRIRLVVAIQSLEQIIKHYGASTAKIFLGNIQTLILGYNGGGGQHGDGHWASDQIGTMTGERYTKPTIANQINLQYKAVQDVPILTVADAARLGLHYPNNNSNSKPDGIKMVIKTSDRVAEIYMPFLKTTEYRPAIVTQELEVSAPTYGRVAHTLQAIIDEMTLLKNPEPGTTRPSAAQAR